jgi:hypothetical protein
MTNTERHHLCIEAAWSRATAVQTRSLAVSVIDVDEWTRAASPDWRTAGDEGSTTSAATDHIRHWRAAGRRKPVARPVPPRTSRVVPTSFPTTLFGSSALIPAP